MPMTVAGNTYTKEQLNRMAASGKYPDQGPILESQNRRMSFQACKVTAERVMSQLRGSYPVVTAVDTNILYIAKSWANDGVTTVTCSKPDENMLVTRSAYR